MVLPIIDVSYRSWVTINTTYLRYCKLPSACNTTPCYKHAYRFWPEITRGCSSWHLQVTFTAICCHVGHFLVRPSMPVHQLAGVISSPCRVIFYILISGISIFWNWSTFKFVTSCKSALGLNRMHAQRCLNLIYKTSTCPSFSHFSLATSYGTKQRW